LNETPPGELSPRHGGIHSLAMKHVLILLNARAGTLLDIGAASVVHQVESALRPHCNRVDVRLLAPRELRKAIADAAIGREDTVIIGGGDGSVSAAVAAFAGGDKVLGVLPFGTLNLLARDLGMPPDPQAAIAVLAAAAPRRIDLAEVNGRPFHTLSGLGFFSHVARAREEVRGHQLGRLAGVALAWFRALRRTAPFSIDVTVGGRRERVTALAALVTNNRFATDWRRPRLDEGLLEMHIVEHHGALTKLKAGAALLTGSWRDEAGIRSIVAGEITVASRRRHTHAATDGERARERLPLRYRTLPAALNVLSMMAGP
jgi:diacylglycerol kinase family enzyme